MPRRRGSGHDCRRSRRLRRLLVTARPHGRKIILVIDDEAPIRKIMDRLLKQYGYETLLADSGDEGIRLFNAYEQDIALVLLDWNLPGVTGKQILATMIDRRPDLRVIVVTGGFEATTDEHATQDTASILLKPFTPTELMLAVRTVLEA